jgi:hypothetical protein
MGQSSGFFESQLLSDGTYDRLYSASQFADHFAMFISNGVFVNPTNQLQVFATGDASISVEVNAGCAYYNGYWFKLDENKTLNLSNASGNLVRYDAIVVGFDFSNRQATLYVKEGDTNYDTEVEKPEIVKTEELYELCLAYVYVDAGAVNLTDANITDTRSDDNLCGFVHGLVDKLDATDLFIQFRSEFESWFETIKGKLGEDIAGSLQLEIDGLETKINEQQDLIGKTDISNIGDGTLTGAIAAQNSKTEEMKNTISNLLQNPTIIIDTGYLASTKTEAITVDVNKYKQFRLQIYHGNFIYNELHFSLSELKEDTIHAGFYLSYYPINSSYWVGACDVTVDKLVMTLSSVSDSYMRAVLSGYQQ